MRDYKKDLIELIQKRPMSYQQILEENFQKMRTPLQTTREAMICSDTDVFIVCSAAINSQGLVLTSVRHGDELFYNACPDATMIVSRWEQGFVTNRCSFVTRKEAWMIAERQGQIRNELPCDNSRRLYSENLY